MLQYYSTRGHVWHGIPSFTLTCDSVNLYTIHLIHLFCKSFNPAPTVKILMNYMTLYINFYSQLRTWGLQEDLSPAVPTRLVDWRSTSVDSGGLCVTIPGAQPTHALLVVSWDLQVLPVAATPLAPM